MNYRINTVAEAIAQLQEIGLTVHRAPGGRYHVFDSEDPEDGFRDYFTAVELIDQARYERDMVAKLYRDAGVRSWRELQMYLEQLRKAGGDAA